MRKLKNYVFPTNQGAPVQYDWDVLLDGCARRLTKGEDYYCKSTSLRTQVYMQASKRDLSARVVIEREEGEEESVVIQAVAKVWK